MGHSPLGYGKIRQSLQLMIVPLHNCGVNLERQTYSTTISHTLYRPFPGSWELTELIVLLLIHRVQGDSHAHSPGILELLCHFQGNQGAIGAKYRPQA